MCQSLLGLREWVVLSWYGQSPSCSLCQAAGAPALNMAGLGGRLPPRGATFQMRCGQWAPKVACLGPSATVCHLGGEQARVLSPPSSFPCYSLPLPVPSQSNCDPGLCAQPGRAGSAQPAVCSWQPRVSRRQMTLQVCALGSAFSLFSVPTHSPSTCWCRGEVEGGSH